MASGPYAITQGTLTADSDYTISFTASTLTITPATLDIAAKPETKVFGSADPALAYTVSGLAFAETPAEVLSGSLSRARGRNGLGRSLCDQPGEPDGQQQLHHQLHRQFPEHHSGGSHDPGRGERSLHRPPFAASARFGYGTPASSLEGVPLSLAYYVGSGTSGTNLGSSPPTAAGNYTVVASFAGTADYSAVQSTPVTVHDRAAGDGRRSALTASVSSAVYGQSVTFVATVAAGTTPAGTVTFLDGGNPLATVALNGSGQATLAATTLSVGTHSITASYSGAQSRWRPPDRLRRPGRHTDRAGRRAGLQQEEASDIGQAWRPRSNRSPPAAVYRPAR